MRYTEIAVAITLGVRKEEEEGKKKKKRNNKMIYFNGSHEFLISIHKPIIIDNY